MSKQKILYFHHDRGLGGAARSLSFLVAGLDRNRYEPTVCMPDRAHPSLLKMYEATGAEILQEGRLRPFNGSTVALCSTFRARANAFRRLPGTINCARQLVGRLNPDLVHLNSTCLVGAAIGSHLANKKMPVIAHVREPLLTNRWGRFLAAMNRWNVDHFISIDEYGLESLGLKNRDNTTVVSNFVDLEKYVPVDRSTKDEIRKSLGWSPDDVIFLSLSRIADSNGIHELGKRILATNDQLPDSFKFVIAGFSEYNTPYENEARQILSGSQRCSVLDFVTKDEVLKLLNACDVVIAPFKTPHSARSVFEGAAVGKPALVSNEPNLLEMIVPTETGVGFDLQDANSFAQAVAIFDDEELREKMGKSARQFAESKYSQAKNIKQTIAVYQQLLV